MNTSTRRFWETVIEAVLLQTLKQLDKTHMNLRHLRLQFEAYGSRRRHPSAIYVAISRTICFKLKQRMLQIHVCLAASKFEPGLR